MPAEYAPAPKEIVDLTQEIIGLHHPLLENARIGVLFRLQAPNSNGYAVLSKARKVGPEEQALYGRPYDFVFWIARDQWLILDEIQKRALIDHTLCHCAIDEDAEKPKMVKPDFEEFNSIIGRYGFWRPHLGKHTRLAVQARLDLERLNGTGYVEAVQPALVGNKDVMEQVGEIWENDEEPKPKGKGRGKSAE